MVIIFVAKIEDLVAKIWKCEEVYRRRR